MPCVTYLSMSTTTTQLLLRCYDVLKSGRYDCVFIATFEQVNAESSIFIIKLENLIVVRLLLGFWLLIC